jgi:hypothetical protein
MTPDARELVSCCGPLTLERLAVSRRCGVRDVVARLSGNVREGATLPAWFPGGEESDDDDDDAPAVRFYLGTTGVVLRAALFEVPAVLSSCQVTRGGRVEVALRLSPAGAQLGMALGALLGEPGALVLGGVSP